MPTQNGLPGLGVQAVEVIDTQHTEDKLLFEQMLGHLPWADVYLALLNEGWGWRKAAYIAWASIPADRRVPRTITTDKEGNPGFANVIGLRDGAAIRTWSNNNPAINAAIAKLQMSTLLDAAPKVIDALVKSASDESYKNAPDRKLFLEMTGLHTPKSTVGLFHDTGNEQSQATKTSREDLERLAGLGGGDE